MFWEKNNKEVISRAIQNGHTEVSGDAQCDSPGHCAKYGVYSFFKQATEEVLGFFVSQSTMAGNSNRMELFGFKKVLEFVQAQGLKVTQITTDRHVQVRKFITENCPNIILQFDKCTCEQAHNASVSRWLTSK